MTKPALGPTRWATDGTNNVAGSSGQRDTGWTNNQVAVSSYFNSLAKAYYDWFEWLDTGDIDVNDLHVLGTLEVDGESTFHDDVLVETDLEVAGTFTADTTSHFVGVVTFDDDIVALDYRHADRTLTSDLGGAIAESGTVSIGFSGGLPTSVVSNPGIGGYPIRGLRAGDRLKSVKVLTASGDTPSYLMYKSNPLTGLATNFPTTTTVSVISPFETIISVNTPFALADGDMLFLRVSNGAGAALTLKAGAMLTYDHP